MSRIVQFRDDFSGKVVDADGISPDFKIRLGDESWVIDATPETIDAMREAMRQFTDKGRMVAGSRLPRHLRPAEVPAIPIAPPVNGNGSNGNGHHAEATNEDIRTWAAAQPEWASRANARGTAFKAVKDAYQAAHLHVSYGVTIRLGA
jgi:hypothetical protein